MSVDGHCSHQGCTKPITARGLCEKHYKDARKDQTPWNICACGCGEKTKNTFKWGHHTRLFPVEEQRRRGLMQTGDALRDTGLCEKTYRKRKGRHEHRVIMEAMIGRPLLSSEHVHHKDGNIRNNDPTNLELLTASEHARHHGKERQLKAWFDRVFDVGSDT